jgi:hypothetical protein
MKRRTSKSPNRKLSPGQTEFRQDKRNFTAIPAEPGFQRRRLCKLRKRLTLKFPQFLWAW